MKLTRLISYCGIPCSTCPIHYATIEEDTNIKKAIRTKIALLCNQNYGTSYTFKDINDCQGCRANSTELFSGCAKCKIRACAIERKYDTCAQCSEYPCNILQNNFASDPGSKVWLEIIRSLL